MQDGIEEHNPRSDWPVGLGASLLLVTAAVAAVDLPLLRAGPLPEDCLAGSGEFWKTRLMAALAALAAGWTTALMTLWPGLRRRTGLYGQVAAALFAALLVTAVPEPLRRPGEALSWPGCFAVALLAAWLSPLLRERGLGSLLWPPLFLGLLLVHGRRQTLDSAARAEPLESVQAALETAGGAAFLGVPAQLPLDERRALVLGLREPFFDRDVSFVMADIDSPEGGRLSELGLTELRLQGKHVSTIRGVPDAGRVPDLDVRASVGAGGAFWVLVDPPADYRISIVTPTGVVRYQQPRGSSPTLDEVRQRELRQLLDPPLPSGAPVLVLAEAAASGLAGWAWVISP